MKSEEDYERMLAEQQGRCFICQREPKGRALSVDHSHATLAVRGLLCFRCNQYLGYINDDIDTVRRLAQYLEDANARIGV